ncbi:MAG: hypothetical protein EXS08_10925 [Planctomycetes bacterium]|nr:hypothetical protein [Planctomycetota bacterium]
MFRLASPCAAFLVVLSLFGARTAAQCPLPDQLDGGPCCTVASPKLPNFPNFTQDVLEICWRDCNVNGVIPYRARWKNLTVAPGTGIPCGERLMLLELLNPLGVLQWSGVIRFQYSRTWLEIDPAGAPLQVWRYLINGDLSPAVTTMAIPCPVPPCVAANNNRARFTGYVDYASSCAIAGNVFQEAWMLTHVCDAIDHFVGFPRGGAFHPDRSYTFVGPGAGFVPGPIQPAEGTPGSPFEAMRRRNLPPLGAVGPATCEFEERLNFNLLPIQQLCMCGVAAAPPQFQIANLTIFGACGSLVTTPGAPFLPGFVSMGLGSWTIPGIFPGVEVLRWNTGGYDYTDACTAAPRREVFFGATTIGGYPAFQLLAGGPGAPLPLTFIDQGNSLRVGFGTTMNVPYVSDHILNLNH